MTRLDKMFVLLGVLLACVAPLAAALLMPKFRDLFSSFGAELPLLTRIVSEYPVALLLMPASVLGVGLAWADERRRGLLSLVVGSVFAVLGSIIVFVAAYLPAWKLAAVT